ncbi:MAG: deoxyribodipyrimidine photo-lyase [Alphaproteobacteria bacterium]|nr:deoxyribodipyrimidine photo-lyase [Alphaproteobacteria bacterium]
MTVTSTPIIYWHRQDLRLRDNPALCWAAERGPVIPVYILCDDDAGRWPLGGASRWWLHHSLDHLRQTYAKRGITLVFRRGMALEALHALAKETGAKSVTWNRCYEPHATERDTQIKNALHKNGITVTSHNAALLHEPWDIETVGGGPYRVFTPFHKACMAAPNPPRTLEAPALMAAPATPVPGDDLHAWRLLPNTPDWASGLRKSWEPGEANAYEVARDFTEDASGGYKADRDRPDKPGTSRLSPHLHFGEISPQQIWELAESAIAEGKTHAAGAEAFLRQLIWREFSYHLLYHFPATAEKPLQPSFAHFPWDTDEVTLRAWQRGRTGFPIVDAGMRQLWQTGWMHNRVRMIVASFLVKDLLIPWQEGARWFWDTLVDADLANNTAGWQWIAGCGADAAPYFRIFNPVLQGKKFDPRGDYVRRFVPELAKLPDAHIHAPWLAPPETLGKAGVILGKNYPEPIVNHAAARLRALDAYRQTRKA